MRIALNHRKFQPRGGIERYLWTMAQKLLERGHEVSAVCSSFTQSVPESITCYRIPVIRLGQSIKALSFAFRSKKFLKEHRFDIIQTFGRTIYGDVYRDGNGSLRVFRQYLEKYETGILSRLSIKLRTYAYLEALRYIDSPFRRIVCVSEMVRQQVLSTYDLPEEKVSVIYPGVDTERFRLEGRSERRLETRSRYSIPESTVVGITVATGFVRKGIEPLLRALARTEGDWRFFILGHDKKLRHYQSLSKELRIHDKLIFTGWQSEVQNFLSASDFFVLNSRFDPSGNSALEAMAMGLPTAVSTKAGFHELIENGRNGFLIDDPDDVSSLASLLKNLIEDDSLRKSAGEQGLKTAEKYTIERNIDDWLSLYHQVLEEKST